MSTPVEALALRRQQIADTHLRPAAARPASSARGLHHTALICSDVEQTVRFYQDVLLFPLTHVTENRDYPGSTHFFFDLGNGNALAFFDLPGLDLGPYGEVLGGLHHIAISVANDQFDRVHASLTDAEVEHVHESGTSVYFTDPDGARLEIIREPLGQMYGERVV
ncbi:MAG: glyoxalase [Frankiales bacterium]|nr:glyoxalase [Frankiales bacterium]